MSGSKFNILVLYVGEISLASSDLDFCINQDAQNYIKRGLMFEVFGYFNYEFVKFDVNNLILGYIFMLPSEPNS